MWLKPARDYYIIGDDLVGVFPPEALGRKPKPEALSFVLRGRGENVKADNVPFRPGTFRERLKRGGLRGVIDMRAGE